MFTDNGYSADDPYMYTTVDKLPTLQVVTKSKSPTSPPAPAPAPPPLKCIAAVVAAIIAVMVVVIVAIARSSDFVIQIIRLGIEAVMMMVVKGRSREGPLWVVFHLTASLLYACHSFPNSFPSFLLFSIVFS